MKLKAYMPNKPIKVSLKMYMLKDSETSAVLKTSLYFQRKKVDLAPCDNYKSNENQNLQFKRGVFIILFKQWISTEKNKFCLVAQ